MKILFIGMYPDEVYPYRNVFFQNLIYAIADNGHNCTVISPIPITRYKNRVKQIPYCKDDYTNKKNKVNVLYPRYISLSNKRIIGVNTGLFSEKLFQKAAIQCAKKLDDDFDVIYGHFFLAGGLAAIKIGKMLNKPAFVAYGECNYHEEVISNFRNLKKKDIEGLCGIIAVSTNNYNILKSKSIFNEIPIIVAPNSVDLNLFKKMNKKECRQKLNLPLDKFIVGFVGGFIDRKGDKRVLEAAKGNNKIKLAFAGKGDNPPVGENVIFCKALSHTDIPIFLNAIDVFCLPTKNEGSCNAIIEAGACGTPIISSDLPFNYDFLNKENSILVNPNSINEIKEAIEVIYKNADIRKKLEEKILFDSSEYSIVKRAEKIITFMEEKSYMS